MSDGEIRCKSCRCTYTDIYGHPVNQCERSPVRWWAIATHPRYNGRAVWLVVAEYNLRHIIQSGTPMRLGRLCDLEALGLTTQYSRGPNSRGLCKWCGEEVAPRRQSWCGDACVEEYRLHHDWNHIRAAVMRRDGGVCVLCGCDTVQARERWRRICRHVPYDVEVAALRRMGWPADPCRDWWEADHIRARHLGGNDHPSNLRTLCVPCHKGVTRQQAKARARRRRDQSASLFQGATA